MVNQDDKRIILNSISPERVTFLCPFRTDAVTIPSTGQQQLPIYPATRPSEDIDEELIREAKSALRAVKDYTLEQDNENVFSRLIIEEPEEFRGN